MFVRAHKYRLENGQVRHGFALLESRRVEGQPSHITLLNLGQEFNIPKQDWPELAKQVVARLKGQPCIPFKEERESFRNAVEDIVKRLLDKGYDIHAKHPDPRDTILTDKVVHPDAKTVGGERLALEALRLLGMEALLRELDFPENHIKLACALIVGRMLSPGSERHTHQWMMHTSSILELLGLESPSLSMLYRCSDRLHKHRHQIMDRLFGNTKTLLDFDETIIFYDLTNIFYHGRQKGELLRRGRSKEKRHDCPLVTLVLTLDASGFPRNVEILPGNASEPATLQQALEHLNGATPTVIMDAGIATKANLAYLKENNLDWICVERTKAPPVPTRAPDQQFETASGVKVRAWNLSEEEETLRVHVHSEARQATEEQILQKKCNQFEAALESLNEGLSLPRRLKNIRKVERKVGRLQEKYQSVAHLYAVEVKQKEGTLLAESVTFSARASHQERTQASGGYVLSTSHTSWSVEKIARTYWRLSEIEATFRVMKSDLGLRPIYHSKDERIEGHLFITVLAYHVSHLMRTKLKANHIHESWDTIRRRLNRVHRITTVMPKSKRRYLVLKVDQQLTPFMHRIFQSLGLHYDPAATRTKEEYSDESFDSEKPPDS